MCCKSEGRRMMYGASPTPTPELAVQDPANPACSDMLQIRRERDDGVGLPQAQDVPLCPMEARLGMGPQAPPLLQDQTGIACSDPPFCPHSHRTGPPAQG